MKPVPWGPSKTFGTKLPVRALDDHHGQPKLPICENVDLVLEPGQGDLYRIVLHPKMDPRQTQRLIDTLGPILILPNVNLECLTAVWFKCCSVIVFDVMLCREEIRQCHVMGKLLHWWYLHDRKNVV